MWITYLICTLAQSYCLLYHQPVSAKLSLFIYSLALESIKLTSSPFFVDVPLTVKSPSSHSNALNLPISRFKVTSLAFSSAPSKTS